ncbi:MAG: hypothetical protein R3F59_39290, partial [Myxococcota bacterium]
MWLCLLLLAPGRAADAPPDDSEPVSLSTQIKRGMKSGLRTTGERVQVTSVRMFPSVLRLSDEEIAALLDADEPLPVGTMLTRDHGRLRISCHHDTCTAAA